MVRKAKAKPKVAEAAPEVVVAPPKEVLDPAAGRCSDCNSLLPEGAAVCPECGEQVKG